MMFERLTRALGIGDGPQPDPDPEPEPDRLPEERRRLGQTGERDRITLAEKREEMIEEQLNAEKRARENGLDVDAPIPENDDRSRAEILTARMEMDLGEREQMQTSDRYADISLRDEYWWHPAFNQSERAISHRETDRDPLVEAAPDDRRMASHTSEGWTLVWDDPTADRTRGGVMETAEWERRQQQDHMETREERVQERDHETRERTDRPIEINDISAEEFDRGANEMQRNRVLDRERKLEQSPDLSREDLADDSLQRDLNEYERQQVAERERERDDPHPLLVDDRETERSSDREPERGFY